MNINLGTQNFWIKAIDTSGNYSATETQAIVSVTSVPFTNIIQSFSEEPAFSGTKTNLVVSGSILAHATGQLSGQYVTPVRDIGFVATFKIEVTPIISDASTARRMNDNMTTRMNDDMTVRMSGQDVPSDASFEINISSDNVIWSGWKPWQVGDYNCRYFQLRMTLVRQTTSQSIQCSAIDYYADLPSVVDSGTNMVSVAASGIATTFVKTFHLTPVVNITILSGAAIYAVVSGLSTTGFTVKLYDATGTAQTGNFSWVSNGV